MQPKRTLTFYNRAENTVSRKTDVTSLGIIPKLKLINSTIRSVNQNNSRIGACAIYIEPWHSEIFRFLDLRKNTGAEELRTRDLFTALWVPDLFMERVRNSMNWSLFCPYKAPNLEKVYGDEFKNLYEKYEREGLQSQTINAQVLWNYILRVQVETVHFV